MTRELRTNLYLTTRPEALSKENHLTEFLAVALRRSSVFRSSYADIVLKDFCALSGHPAVIEDVQTQVPYQRHGNPDMQLTLADGAIVLCEHKLQAEETVALRPDDGDSVSGVEWRQLRKYLDAPGPLGVAYFAESWKILDDEVLSDPRFIRPASRGTVPPHFLWRDLYPALRGASGDEIFVAWLREAFEILGYTPAVDEVGALEGPTPDVVENQRNFAKLWTRARSIAATLGWRKVDPGSRFELYLSQNADALAEAVWISPSLRGRFRIRFTPRDSQIETLRTQLTAASEDSAIPSLVEILFVSRKVRIAVVEVSTALSLVLEGTTTAVEREERLGEFVARFLAAANPSNFHPTENDEP
ncbi:MAG TPA: hypothetical protein VIN63_05000 [Candidatus Limnocylindria bacterium]